MPVPWAPWPQRAEGSGRLLVVGILRRPELPAVDELDPVAVGIGDEGDARELLAAARAIGRLLGSTPSGRRSASVRSRSATVKAMWL
jgi:hypothetical protein